MATPFPTEIVMPMSQYRPDDKEEKRLSEVQLLEERVTLLETQIASQARSIVVKIKKQKIKVVVGTAADPTRLRLIYRLFDAHKKLLIVGPPQCGKTALMESIKLMAVHAGHKKVQTADDQYIVKMPTFPVIAARRELVERENPCAGLFGMAVVHLDYDPIIERHVCPHEGLYKDLLHIRKNCRKKYPELVTTVTMKQCYEMVTTNFSYAEIIELLLSRVDRTTRKKADPRVPL